MFSRKKYRAPLTTAASTRPIAAHRPPSTNISTMTEPNKMLLWGGKPVQLNQIVAVSSQSELYDWTHCEIATSPGK
jgi:hypothetical protein